MRFQPALRGGCLGRNELSLMREGRFAHLTVLVIAGMQGESRAPSLAAERRAAPWGAPCTQQFVDDFTLTGGDAALARFDRVRVVP